MESTRTRGIDGARLQAMIQDVFLLGLIQLDRDTDTPLYQQIYASLRRAILAGQLHAGTRLTSSRDLAALLGVSRNTVMNAYDQLIAEGYLDSREKSGTYITDQLPDELLAAYRSEAPAQQSPAAAVQLSARGQRYADLYFTRRRYRATAWNHAFSVGLPALDQFPFALWGRLLTEHFRYPFPGDFGYGDKQGYSLLREALGHYLATARAVHCTADQIVITTGSQQAIFAAAQLLLDPSDDVWLEDPGYLGARAAFTGAEAQIVPVPVDEQGLDVRAGIARAPAAKLVYVTPSHQYPLGMTMSAGRRLELLNWAAEAGAWIIEDDYDSEYRYENNPVAALQGLDNQGRVIYIGTFSKVLFPGIRLGYVVLPEALVEPFAQICRTLHDHTSRLNQVVAAQFIQEGHFTRHIRRMRKLYLSRRDSLVAALQEHMQGILEPGICHTGMDMLGWLPVDWNDEAVWTQAGEAGIDTQPLGLFYQGQPPRPGIVMGYAGVDATHIETAVLKLRDALRSD